jgi:hypothetical protein
MGRPKGRKTVTRLNLDLTAESNEELRFITAKCKAGSLTESIRRAISLMHMMATETEKGAKVVVRQKDGSEEVWKLV